MELDKEHLEIDQFQLIHENPEIIKLINQKIKMRDFWMPFTPSILSEYKEKYLVNEKKLYCPYMTMAFKTTKLFQKIIHNFASSRSNNQTTNIRKSLNRIS